MAAAAEVDSAAAARRLAYRNGLEIARDALLLAAAKDGAQAGSLAALREWHVPVFPIRGADARRQGLSPGPKIGIALRTVEDWWLQADFMPNRAACLARLKQEIAKDQHQ